MHRFIHISPFHRVLMDIVQFLPEYLFVFDKLRVRSLFPALIIPILLVTFAEKRQLLQQSLGVAFLEMVDQFTEIIA